MHIWSDASCFKVTLYICSDAPRRDKGCDGRVLPENPSRIWRGGPVGGLQVRQISQQMMITRFNSKMPMSFSGLMLIPDIAPGCRRTGRQKGLLHQAQCGPWTHSSQRKYHHFGFASSDSHHRVETDPADHEHGQGEVIDYVKVPETLEPGWVFVAII